MNITQRIRLLVQLGEYLVENAPEWQALQERAYRMNLWFEPAFIQRAVQNIAGSFLTREALENLVEAYQVADEMPLPKTVGIVMAGNIPLVGFHDFLCCFITGHISRIKLSSKDELLLPHLVAKLAEWDPEINQLVSFSERLNGCDAYLATGSNNTSRYFEYYFARFPHIIRKNRTSVALLDGEETSAELASLAEDVLLYFGLGCRNVTQLYVPRDYNFIPLLAALKAYPINDDNHKYRNNYDYNLALHMLNGTYYMTNESVLLIEHLSPFSPISQLHYQFYSDAAPVLALLKDSAEIQAIVGHAGIPFGQAQQPALRDYADGVDTMQWLLAF